MRKPAATVRTFGNAVNPTASSYFLEARSPRFRATRRRPIREAARQGMLVTGGMALLNSVWLIALHAEAWALVLSINAAVALIASIGYVSLGTVAARRPEAVVFVILIVVDVATIVLALGYPALGLVAAGYGLLLPIVVALLVPWGTKTHVRWLGVHVAIVLGYVLLAAAPERPGGRLELLGLLVVAILVSQTGHVTGLRHQVLSFVQVEQIKALNRQARRDRRRLDALNLALAESATTDALTGLGNRFALDAGLKLARSRIERHRERYGLMIMDLDRFKAINDTRGHIGGDEVLRAIATAIRARLRPGDTVYRYGGEEFVVLMPIVQPADALVAAERIRRAIEGLGITSTVDGQTALLTLSIGVTTVGPEDLEFDDETWLGPADAALYRAKAAGRNRCETGQQRSASARVGTGSPPPDRRSEGIPKAPVPA